MKRLFLLLPTWLAACAGPGLTPLQPGLDEAAEEAVLGRQFRLDMVERPVVGQPPPGEVDEHVAYVPITSVSRQAMQMQTVEVTARSTQTLG